MRETILIVDTSLAQLQEKERILQQVLHYQTAGVLEAGLAVEWVRAGRKPAPDIVLLDMDIGAAVTMDTLRALKALQNNLPVIIMTSYGDHQGAVDSIRAGASDFLSKPVPSERLQLSIENALEMQRMCRYIAWLESKFISPSEDSGNAAESTPSPVVADAPLFIDTGRKFMLIDAEGKIRTLKNVQEEAIRFALKQADGCMTRAARSLGIGRSTLYRKVSEFSIEGYISRANQTTRPMIKVSSMDRS